MSSSRDRRAAHLPLWLAALAIGAFGVRVGLVWDDLPPVLASHFGFSGQPDGWMSKPAFFAFDAALIALFATLLLWIRIIPPQLINVALRHREYWFAPERRRESLARMAPWFNWLTCITTFFLIFVLDQVVRANLTHSPIPLSGAVGKATLGLLVALAFWSFSFYRAFRDLPASPRAPV